MENKSKELLSLVRALNLAIVESPDVSGFQVHGDLVHLQDDKGTPVAIIKIQDGNVKLMNVKNARIRTADLDITIDAVAVIVSAMLGQKGIVIDNKPVQPAPQAQIEQPAAVVEQPAPVEKEKKGSFFDLNRK